MNPRLVLRHTPQWVYLVVNKENTKGFNF